MTKPEPQTMRRELMATTFSVTFAHPDMSYGRRAVQEALDEAGRIESRLSRYLEHSDLARLNRLRRGQAMRVHPDVMDALRIALRMHQLTGGAFDVAYASARRPEDGIGFRLDAKRGAVQSLCDQCQFDLGGIGKGFALDRARTLLADWDIQSVLLSAGGSTLLAGDPPPAEAGWSVAVGPDLDSFHLHLARRAVSASGTSIRGRHIIDPATGRASDRRRRAWAGAPTAAVADALSTAFMVMPAAAIARLCQRQNEIGALLQESAIAAASRWGWLRKHAPRAVPATTHSTSGARNSPGGN